MTDRLKNFTPVLLLVIVLIYFFFRLFNIQNNVNFADEQGRFALSALNIWENKRLVLIGPPTSLSFQGRYFYQGPLTYYLLIPPLLVGQGDPLYASYFLILLNLGSLILIYLATKKLFGTGSGLLAATLFAVYPDTVFYTKFIWNPNFLPLVASLVLALLANLGNFKPKLRLFLFGLFFGIGLQFHYQFLLIIIPTTIYLMIKNKNRLVTISLIGLGFIVGYCPLILFEIRNHFYNSQTMLFLMRNSAFKQDAQPPSYYFLSLTPLIFSYISSLPFKLNGRLKLLTIGIISILLYTSVLQSSLQLFGNRGMPKNYRYPDIQKVVGIITDQHLSKYNVVNLLSGDTRSYALRYFLKIAKSSPEGIRDYPTANNLFVLSYMGKSKTEANSVWEINSFKGYIKKTWLIKTNPNIYLYLMTKS